ncbi:MAG: hypothetical protein U0R52_04005 [Solirubrobacterales bacterium]
MDRSGRSRWAVRSCGLLFAGLSAIGPLSGCGGEGGTGSAPSSPVPPAGRTASVWGRTLHDQRIADDLREYLRRGCGEAAPTYPEFLGAISSPHADFEAPPGAVRRYYVAVFGSLRNGFRALMSKCEVTSVRVSDGVITLRARLGHDRLALITARRVLCSEIQGSDVADRTPGHRVLAQDGTVLARCPARSG